MRVDVKKCLNCGRNAVLIDTGWVWTGIPAKYEQEWMCKCGTVETSAPRVEKTRQEMFKQAWHEANP